MEHKWRQYLAVKKHQKQKKKRDELFNTDLTPEQRIKHLQPVEELVANLQTQAKRFKEQAVATKPYKGKEKKMKIQKKVANVVFTKAPSFMDHEEEDDFYENED